MRKPSWSYRYAAFLGHGKGATLYAVSRSDDLNSLIKRLSRQQYARAISVWDYQPETGNPRCVFVLLARR